MKIAPPMEMINCFMEPCDSIYEARGRLTEWAKPTASSIQMKYQPMSV
jgi:hypothetical protein